MRLLDAATFEFHEFYSNPPAYAILSHTWGNDRDEVSYRDIVDSKADSRPAWQQKVVPCAKQAIKDGYTYIWIDTCCIDKSSAVELSEAINSMYRWYQQSKVCYVVMLDVYGSVKAKSGRYRSRWFTRGWTLQELLAPSIVHFFSGSWESIGSRNDMAFHLWMLTGIELKYLTGAAGVKEASVAERMSWASRRETKRPEDRAYSLLGLFDISMPPIYGEGGEQAFQRLQEHIIKKLPDDSILAWGYNPMLGYRSAVVDGATSLLAQSPNDFMFCRGFTLRGDDDEYTVNPTPTCIMNVTTSVFQVEARFTKTRDELGRIWLNCRHSRDSDGNMTIVTVPIAWRTSGHSPIFYRPRIWSISYSEPRDTVEQMRKITLSVNSHNSLIQPVTQRGTFRFEWNASEMEIMSRSPENAWNKGIRSFVFDSGPVIMAVRFRPVGNRERSYAVIVVSPTREFNESTRWLVMEHEDYSGGLNLTVRRWPDFSSKSREDSFPFRMSIERELSIQTTYIKLEARYIFKIISGPPEPLPQSTFLSVKDEMIYLLMGRKAIKMQSRIDSLQDEKKKILEKMEKLGQEMSRSPMQRST